MLTEIDSTDGLLLDVLICFGALYIRSLSRSTGTWMIPSLLLGVYLYRSCLGFRLFFVYMNVHNKGLEGHTTVTRFVNIRSSIFRTK